MKLLYFFIILIFSIASAKETLITPCGMNDVPCLQKSAKEYLANAAAGLGEPYNTKPVDPIDLPDVDVPGCCVDPPTSIFHLKNIKITGLKDITLTGFKMDEATKTIYINSTADIKMTSDLTLEYTEKGKSFSGKLEFKPKVFMRSHYNFEMKNDDKGVEHLDIGPETSECECVTDPEFKFDDDLKMALENDPDAKAKLEKYPTELADRRKKLACRIADLTVPRIFDAFRQGCKVMSTSDLFIDKNNV